MPLFGGLTPGPEVPTGYQFLYREARRAPLHEAWRCLAAAVLRHRFAVRPGGRRRSRALVRQVARGGRQVKRKLGPKRASGTRDGLTRAQAERELRRLMDEIAEEPLVEELSLEEAGRRHVDRLVLLGRKRSTLMDYRSTLRVHLVPFFGDARSRRSRPTSRALPHGEAARRPGAEEHPQRPRPAVRRARVRREARVGGEQPVKHVELPRPGTHDDGDIRYLRPRRSRRCAARFPAERDLSTTCTQQRDGRPRTRGNRAWSTRHR